MAATMDEVLGRFLIEAGRSDPQFLHRSDGSLFVSKEGVLYYDRSGRGNWGRGRPARNIPLAQFIGNRYKGGFMYLNGDGLEDNEAMGWQTRVRERAQREFTWQRCAVIPISAIRAVEIEIETIKPLEVTQDREDTVAIWLPDASWAVLNEYMPMSRFEENGITNRSQGNNVSEVPWEEFSRYSTTGIRSRYEFRSDGYRWLVELEKAVSGSNHTAKVRRMWIWAQPENGVAAWQTVTWSISPVLNQPQWLWQQQVHRLGACVFSAKDAVSSSRTRWLSAFDTLEPEPMYFLAQLPRVGKIKTYDDAVFSLAPPTVHRAWEERIPVYRQGDVFAIETQMTDEQVYTNAYSVARRDIALQEPPRLLQQGIRVADGHEREVQEEVECPYCQGHTLKVWCGPEAKRALMIHNTGHTASEVVKHENGVIFIRGTMYHDPQLETPGRNAEHRVVTLGEENKWYICVRNTVPRLRRKSTDSPLTSMLTPWPGMGMGNAFYTTPELSRTHQPPPGYQWTGEFRVPDVALGSTEIWLTNDGSVRVGAHSLNRDYRGGERHILRQ